MVVGPRFTREPPAVWKSVVVQEQRVELRRQQAALLPSPHGALGLPVMSNAAPQTAPQVAPAPYFRGPLDGGDGAHARRGDYADRRTGARLSSLPTLPFTASATKNATATATAGTTTTTTTITKAAASLCGNGIVCAAPCSSAAYGWHGDVRSADVRRDGPWFGLRKNGLTGGSQGPVLPIGALGVGGGATAAVAASTRRGRAGSSTAA